MTDQDLQVEALRRTLDDAGLARVSSELVALAKPGVSLVADPGALTRSRLGGLPDLAAGTEWPAKDGVALSFIAQIDLAEVSDLVEGTALPDGGLLSFFYDAVSQQAWGFDPADAGAAAVLYTPAEAEVSRREPPAGLDEEGRFVEVPLRAEAQLFVPGWQTIDVQGLSLTREEQDAYEEVDPDVGTHHRLLGHPLEVQGEMQLECQLVTHGLYCGDPSGYADPRAVQLEPGARDWRLLLQVDSEQAAGMMWGDLGRLYYWIRQEDLDARRWDRSWLILQCG